MKTLRKYLPLLLAIIAFIGLDQPLFADESAPYVSIDASEMPISASQFPILLREQPSIWNRRIPFFSTVCTGG